MNVIFDEYQGQVVPISVHTWWPNSGDPWYVYAFPEDSLRVRYYAGVAPWIAYLYTPSLRYDGKYLKDPYDDDVPDLPWYYKWVRNTLDSLLAIPSPLRIDITDHHASADTDSVYVSFDVVAEDTITFNMNVYLAVTQWRDRINPWGKNDDVLMDYVPDQNGYAIGPMLPGESYHFDWAYVFDPVAYRTDRVVTNIFVQRSGTRKVQQTATRDLIPRDVSGVEVADVSTDVLLGRNLPNPFRSETDILYSLECGSKVHLAVYTLEGRLVASLVDGYTGPGSHSVRWDGRDGSGREVASGVYYYRIETERESRAGKMILLR